MTDSTAKQHALEQFATFINPQKVRVMRAAGLDIVEAERSGAWVWDIDGARFLDCFTSAGSFNVGRRNPRVLAAAHAARRSTSPSSSRAAPPAGPGSSPP